MALTPRLELRQAQTLVMTPQLQQAIKLLQLSNLELSDYVEQELEKNPLLERDEGGPDDGLDPQHTDDRTDEMAVLDARPGQDEAPLDVELDNTFTNESVADVANEALAALDANLNIGMRGSGGGGVFSEGENVLEQTISDKVSLRDYLTEQVNMDLSDPADRVIALNLMENLDESGYIASELSEIAEVLGCELARVEATLETLQAFDPPGIFARDLAECLQIQLKDKNRLDPAMQALLDNLDLLAKRDFSNLLKLCGIDREDLIEMIDEIKALNPKPALAFDHSVAQSITPDVIMRPLPKGGWIVELNTETLPRVLVDSRYYAMINKAARNKEDKAYVSECLQSASWLVKSLHQRATTILKVATEIIRQQDAFFLKGVEHLRPLILRDIAEEIEMHESTVSRVTSNKYMATPRGIYELKYFFTQSIAASDGSEAHSAESVRHRIKTLIDEEDRKKILSDDKIVTLLNSDGIDIARRTVAKYREGMGISSSVQRRREKNSTL